MSGKERLVRVTEPFQGFQFAGYVKMAFLVLSNIERNDANSITDDEEFVFFFIIESKCKDAIQLF